VKVGRRGTEGWPVVVVQYIMRQAQCFLDDDNGYPSWLAQHLDGFVVNFVPDLDVNRTRACQTKPTTTENGRLRRHHGHPVKNMVEVFGGSPFRRSHALWLDLSWG
jgi:hypothetical protein